MWWWKKNIVLCIRLLWETGGWVMSCRLSYDMQRPPVNGHLLQRGSCMHLRGWLWFDRQHDRQERQIFSSVTGECFFLDSPLSWEPCCCRCQLVARMLLRCSCRLRLSWGWRICSEEWEGPRLCTDHIVPVEPCNAWKKQRERESFFNNSRNR